MVLKYDSTHHQMNDWLTLNSCCRKLSVKVAEFSLPTCHTEYRLKQRQEKLLYAQPKCTIKDVNPPLWSCVKCF